MTLPIIHNTLYVIQPRFLLGLLASLVTIAIGIFIIKGYNQLYFLEETNITPFSSTLTWLTPTPSTGCALILNLPVRFVCEPSSHHNHHLTLADLRPKTTYRLLLLSGTNFGFYIISHPFVPDQIPSLPNVAYGKLVTSDTNQPLAGATIIARTQAGPVSTTTNANGTWSLDLRNSIKPDTVVPVTIIWRNFYFDQDVILIGQHQPAPDFEILDQSALDQAKQSNAPFGPLDVLRI